MGKYDKVYGMMFKKVYPFLVAKAEKKGRTLEDVLSVTSWLTGYAVADIVKALNSDITYGDFFLQAPQMNSSRHLIKGSICGVKLAEIDEPLMQDIRYLDKLVDELAKGKPLEKILPN